jgi:DNA-directed RNA polymerase subunit RPC12/RpoP
MTCGADVRWDPGAQSLRCDYCGSVREVPRDAAKIAERLVDDALRAPRDLGWGAQRKAIHCNRCGATTTFDPNVAASACAFCGTASVVEAPLDGNMVRPEGLLPFRVTKQSATGKFREWLGGLWFRPNDLKQKSSLTKLQGAYIPFWTFDAATHSAWTADAGHYYYVQVRRGNQTVSERRVRWEPASGTLELFFDDLPVPASRGLDGSICQEIEPFPTAELTPYEPSYIAGFLAEEYAIGVEESLGLAKERMKREIYAACGREVPGDTHRNLEVQTAFSGIAYKNALLPIWVAAYEYAGKPYRFLVNGVTGKVAGHAPFSWIKVGLAMLAALIVFVVIVIVKGS